MDRKCEEDAGRIELTVILRPICKMFPPNYVLEDETDDSPWNEIDCRRRRNLADSRKDEAAITSLISFCDYLHRQGITTHGKL